VSPDTGPNEGQGTDAAVPPPNPCFRGRHTPGSKAKTGPLTPTAALPPPQPAAHCGLAIVPAGRAAAPVRVPTSQDKSETGPGPWGRVYCAARSEFRALEPGAWSTSTRRIP